MLLMLLQVYVGRQHHLAVEIGGQQFELTLNNQPTEAGSTAEAGAAPQPKALPMPQVSVTGVPTPRQHAWQHSRDTVLTGPAVRCLPVVCHST